jgi:hypothetical protein
MNYGHENDTTTEGSASDSRRKFLQKTTAGVVISSLPATSVWAQSGGGGILNSIVASTNASGWTDGQMALLSYGTWKTSQASISEGFVFSDVFGGEPLKNGTPLNSNSTFAYKIQSNNYTVQASEANFLQVMEANGSALENVNFQICAMYLNAVYGKNDGSALFGLNFPVVNAVTGRPFAKLSDYATWLYNNAKLNPSGFSSALSDLIINNHA